MGAMRVAVVDVGSNTARLLVADVEGNELEPVREEKAYLGLAAEIMRDGCISSSALSRTSDAVTRYARLARRDGVERLETFVTAPGRQAASSQALVARLEEATRRPVEVLSAEDEGRLAFAGALARAGEVSGVVAVCDVGGGSTEIAVGTRLLGPAWVRSADIGSLRLTHGWLAGDPPGAEAVARARDAAREALRPLVPPRPDVAFAVGGSARAAAKLVGRELGRSDLDDTVDIAHRRSAAKLARIFGLDIQRAHTLLAGAIILGEVVRLLGVEFKVARGGLREGAALALAGADRAAAA